MNLFILQISTKQVLSKQLQNKQKEDSEISKFNSEISKGNISAASKIITNLYTENKEKKSSQIISKYADFLLKTGEYKLLIDEFSNNKNMTDNKNMTTLIKKATLCETKIKENNYAIVFNLSPYSKKAIEAYLTDSIQKQNINLADKIFMKMPKEYHQLSIFRKLKIVSKLMRLEYSPELRQEMASFLIPKTFLNSFERAVNRIKRIKENLQINENKEDVLKLKVFSNKIKSHSEDKNYNLFSFNVFRILYIEILKVLVENYQFTEYAQYIEAVIKETADMNYRKLYIKYLVFNNRNEEALSLINEYEIKDPLFKSEIEGNISEEKRKLQLKRDKEIKERKAKNPQDSEGHYKTLGCNPWDPQEIIKESYREKLKDVKKIKNKEKQKEETLKLTKAFDVLKSEESREAYDSNKKDMFGHFNPKSGGQHFTDVEDLFEQFFGGNSRRRNHGRNNRRTTTYTWTY